MSRIALLDSGIGGLSVLQAIKQQIPNASILYFADHAYSPYGNKDTLWLNHHIVQLVSALNHQHKLDAIVIACNTASTLCLAQLRQCINTPIIGVVPAVKTAANLTKNQSIGVLATPTTIHGEYLKSLISDFAHQCQITKVASTELVSLAEKKLNKQPIEQKTIAHIIEPLIKSRCDYVVLGCTHFPHLKPELTALAAHINWIDSADAIAKRCISLLEDTHIENNNQTPKPHMSFYSSAQINNGLHLTLTEFGFTHIQANVQLYDVQLNSVHS